ncbi:MAG TPA: DEAD/DEAH box helicase [Anaerolineae bacterium]|nr:DEAD/DEAH box helicase [Anaerolineae bacterium]
MSILDAFDGLRNDPDFMRNVTAWERLAPQPAFYGEVPPELDRRLTAALANQGISALYKHQAAAIRAALDGENVVVVTRTASGKTLCYNLPVLHMLLNDPEARALYLFPTKALSQDQAAALSALLRELRAVEQVPVRTYDGDTPQARRRRIRGEARLLISNPDMLHAGILPHHPRWATLLQNLRWVVLDELHVYRGVFGSNVANLIRRLKRLCRFYGSDPQFILTSATIANPKELGEKLIEAPVSLISADLDGSPRAEKHVVLYNPPVIEPNLGIRRAYTLETTSIAERLLTSRVQTVVFARARLTTEVLLGYVRDAFERMGGDPTEVRGYRGGYLPLERREIERGLRDGSVKGVVATNALELGVDIGQLGAAVIAGYPGTIASLWQQAGRAGRRNEVSLVVLAASGAPLDQFVITHPRFLFERPTEMGLINPDNLSILLRHLRCAVFELPFRPDEHFGSFDQTAELLDFLVEEGELHRSNGTYRWLVDFYPAEGVSLRSGGNDTVVIQDVGEGRPNVIGEVDRTAASILLHEGAVYTHEGRTFLVERLDWENALAEVVAAHVDYYTDASENTDLEILEVADADENQPARRAHGWARITAQATSFRKVKRYTHETLGYGPIDLPPRAFETSAYWLWIEPEMVEQLEAEGVLHAPVDYGPSWERARRQALDRDGQVCRQCGALPREGRSHDVHHLRPFREFGYLPGENRNDRSANDLDNLITLCPTCHHRAEAARGARSALAGLAYALSNVAPLFLMCDPRDLGTHVEIRSPRTQGPTITIYDRVPEGLGLSERIYELHTDLIAGALELVRGCGCQDGCPVCVGPVGPGGLEIKTLTTQLAERLLQRSDDAS